MEGRQTPPDVARKTAGIEGIQTTQIQRPSETVREFQRRGAKVLPGDHLKEMPLHIQNKTVMVAEYDVPGATPKEPVVTTVIFSSQTARTTR